MDIKRYSLKIFGSIDRDTDVCMAESERGQYVLYAEHKERLRERAKQVTAMEKEILRLREELKRARK